MPHDFDDMDEDTFLLWAEFMGLENEAARIKTIPPENG
jgi:hypothetical protein